MILGTLLITGSPFCLYLLPFSLPSPWLATDILAPDTHTFHVPCALLLSSHISDGCPVWSGPEYRHASCYHCADPFPTFLCLHQLKLIAGSGWQTTQPSLHASHKHKGTLQFMISSNWHSETLYQFVTGCQIEISALFRMFSKHQENIVHHDVQGRILGNKLPSAPNTGHFLSSEHSWWGGGRESSSQTDSKEYEKGLRFISLPLVVFNKVLCPPPKHRNLWTHGKNKDQHNVFYEGIN